MNLIPEIEASHEEIKALRRTIHAYPELRYEEVGTASSTAPLCLSFSRPKRAERAPRR
ncbi:MAG: hypothetical protein CBARDCOR_6387 [uncultured Caballeronia sp.]|nr:MAG: hypothetical protein CBARDCOR_6387 [uncultured Caballeronia sp.]